MRMRTACPLAPAKLPVIPGLSAGTHPWRIGLRSLVYSIAMATMGVEALTLLAAAAPLAAAGADPICAAEYAARCPRGWAYAPSSGGSCARPPSYTGHCGTTD
eukprot:COSAG04_NODE_15128_length_542_cov_2.214447_1_plen_102_part_10